MADTKLYKVAITPCGKYVHGTEYDRLCLVLNATEDGGDGCSYVSLQKNRNVRPGTDDTIWALSLERGEQGERGPSGAGFSQVSISVDGTSGTPSGTAVIANDTLYLSFSGMKGEPGEIDEDQLQDIEDQISAKQDALVSGTNIKTIGNQSILGSGNIQVGDENAVKFISQSLTDSQKAQARTNIGIPVISTDISADAASDTKTASPKAVKTYVDAHSGSGTDPEAVKFTSQSLTSSQKEQARTNIDAQETLVGTGAGQNIKTINQTSLLGSGDITVEDGVGFESIATPTTTDGTAIITLTNGDTITLDLNHQHTQYPKYVYCATQAAYDAITTKESDTLYLILESN